jgi:alcohol dehydrogenase, propanol-preferring
VLRVGQCKTIPVGVVIPEMKEIMMKKLMKAAVAHKFNAPLIIEEVPVPTVNSKQILVKIAGVCHTDLHAISGDWPVKPTLPLIPGHEGAGFVTAVGSEVKSIKEGDRVGIPWLYTACGQCEFCLTGWETLCLSQKNTGYSINGCYAEYVLADPQYVGHLPDELEFPAAASLLCAGVTVYKGIKETDTKPGDWLVISGIGGLGHMAVQYAKAMGRNVVAIDIHEPQLELARQLKADLVINASLEDSVERIQKEIKGAQGVLVTAVSPVAFTQAVNMLRPRGTLCLVGLPPGTFELSIFDIVLHRKTVRGSIVGTRMDLAECLSFAAEGKVAVHYTLDKLENINNIFTKMKAGETLGRIVLQI